MIFAIPFPAFKTTLIDVGPFHIKYYALAYIVSLILGWQIVRRLVRLDPHVATAEQTDDFLTWATLGVVLGGRLGYVLFYQPLHYLQHPLDAVAVWQGGMSFHGGALGVVIALLLFCRNRGINFFGFSDRVCTIVPMGLGIGRCANFINGELWGRPVLAQDISWWVKAIPFQTWWSRALHPVHPWWLMTFPGAPDYGTVPRHPSQLYEAGMEGLILLLIMLLLCSRRSVRARFGLLSGVFLVGYALARIVGEHFREPDRFLGFLPGGLTMGQVLSVPMLLVGAALILRARRHAPMVVA